MCDRHVPGAGRRAYSYDTGGDRSRKSSATRYSATMCSA